MTWNSWIKLFLRFLVKSTGEKVKLIGILKRKNTVLNSLPTVRLKIIRKPFCLNISIFLNAYQKKYKEDWGRPVLFWTRGYIEHTYALKLLIMSPKHLI